MPLHALPLLLASSVLAADGADRRAAYEAALRAYEQVRDACLTTEARSRWSLEWRGKETSGEERLRAKLHEGRWDFEASSPTRQFDVWLGSSREVGWSQDKEARRILLTGDEPNFSPVPGLGWDITTDALSSRPDGSPRLTLSSDNGKQRLQWEVDFGPDLEVQQYEFVASGRRWRWHREILLEDGLPKEESWHQTGPRFSYRFTVTFGPWAPCGATLEGVDWESALTPDGPDRAPPP